MSSWNDFKADASKVASKVAVKTGEIADAATAHVRLQTLKLRLCEEYEKLGRLTYKSTRADEPIDTADQIAKIDDIRAEIQQLRDEIAAKKN
ncbi:MAG: hypothetical protein IJY27_04465 [Clostridia bacterium]|nr:hypothetical protein [Clostridia bacterium]